MVESLQAALNKSGIELDVSLFRMYGAEGIKFCGVSPSQMIADKISAISTDKVFRRVKDEKFRFEGGVNKPPFETVYKSAQQ